MYKSYKTLLIKINLKIKFWKIIKFQSKLRIKIKAKVLNQLMHKTNHNWFKKFKI